MPTSRPALNPVFRGIAVVLAVASQHLASASAVAPTFMVGSDAVSVVFEDQDATLEAKTLFVSDLERVVAAGADEARIAVVTNDGPFHPAIRLPPDWSPVQIRLKGMREPKFTNGDVTFPPTLVHTNGALALVVDKAYTDGFAALLPFAAAHSNEIAQLRSFVANDLAKERLEGISDDDIYEMYLSRQWEPGDREGPSRLESHDRPQIVRGTYFQPPVAAVLSWPMGPDDAPEHLWAQINVKTETDGIYEVRAIYWNGKWWLTQWEWEEGDPVWDASDFTDSQE